MSKVLAVWCLALLCACATPGRQSGPDPSTGKPVLSSVVPNSRLCARVVDTMDTKALGEALRRSLRFVRGQNPQVSPFSGPGPRYTWQDVRRSLEYLLESLPRLAADPDLLDRDFLWYEMTPSPLCTGYYAPEIEASLVPDPAYPVPLHGLPTDLQSVDLGAFHPRWSGQHLTYRLEEGRVVPFFSRAEILQRGGSVAPPLAWARDPVDVFFLQIQGSGRLRLPDGSVRDVAYAGKNGHEYVSLGKVMVRRGLLPSDQVSMQAIRAYLEAHPEQVGELLNTNPSYVFFRLAEHGPVGAMGQALTPMVSVATDSTFLPLGALLVLDVPLPRTDGSDAGRPFVALAQDRGGAIKGARLDVFCGSGPDAEFVAGHLQAVGRVYLLLRK